MPKTKTSSKKPAKPTKAAFVRGIPDTVSAKDVVAKAKAAGMTLTEKHVYVIRSEARKRSARKLKSKGGGAPTKASVKAIVTARSGSADETNFRKLVLVLGVQKSKSLVGDVERRLASLIAGK